MEKKTSYNELIQRFRAWMDQAAKTEINDPNAVCLATVSKTGMPNARIVLLKKYDIDNHFVFFTNSLSQKGEEIAANPVACLCAYWKSTSRQIRVRGTVKKVPEELSDSYFSSRHRNSQFGAWISKQSDPLESRGALESRLEEMKLKYKGQDIPRPPHWHGFQILPQDMEFWQAGEYRLHTRELYKPETNDIRAGWKGTLLNP